MKRFATFLCLLLGLAIALPAQQASTQYQHIGYSWNPGALTVCTSTTTTSCVKDYVFAITDPTGAAQTPITIPYTASTYQYGPGGFLYCGDWKSGLAIEYFDENGSAKTTAPDALSTTVSCPKPPFVPSPPSGRKGTPSA